MFVAQLRPVDIEIGLVHLLAIDAGPVRFEQEDHQGVAVLLDPTHLAAALVAAQRAEDRLFDAIHGAPVHLADGSVRAPLERIVPGLGEFFVLLSHPIDVAAVVAGRLRRGAHIGRLRQRF